jgi:hypothetical protein
VCGSSSGKSARLRAAGHGLDPSCATGGSHTAISAGILTCRLPGLRYKKRSLLNCSSNFRPKDARIRAGSAGGRATRRRTNCLPSVVSNRMSPTATWPSARRITSEVIGRGLGEDLGRRRAKKGDIALLRVNKALCPFFLSLKPLARDGLIAIEVDPTDRRNRLIQLTRSGQAKLKESDALWEAAQRSFEAGFRGAESDALREVMRRLVSDDFAQAFESALASAG